MDSRDGESSYGEGGGVGGGGGDAGSGLGSYAMMGVDMSGPHHQHQQYQQQEGGWMKRHRPNDVGAGPPEWRGLGGGVGGDMDGPFRDRGGGPSGPVGLGPGPAGRGLDRGPPAFGGPERGPPGDGMGRFPPRAEWDRDHVAGGGGGPPPLDRMMPRGGAGVGMGDGDNRPNAHIPPSQDDQFGRGIRERNEPPRLVSTEEDQFGRQRPPPQRSNSSGRGGGFGGRGFPASNLNRQGSGVGSAAPSGNQNSLHMSGRFVPGGGMDNPNNPDAEDQRGFYHQHQNQQAPHQYSGVSPRESGYTGNIAQRFEGPPDSSMNRSQPPPAWPNAFAASQSASSHPAAPLKQSATGQTHANDTSASYNAHHEQHRSQTPTPGAGPNLNQGVAIRNESSADIVPESPKQTTREEDNAFICPPSPPPAAPSAYALALSRMIEMNEDMEFAYARLIMLEHEHKKIQARLETLETMQLEEGNTI